MTLFALGLLGSLYIWIGYPVLIGLLARIRPAPVRREAPDASCSLVVVAHNEAARLPRKLASVLASDAVDRLVEVLVASDGSTDDTEAAVAAIGDPRVRCLAFRERRGKAAVLNEVVPRCRGDLVVLTDARQDLDPAALRRLLERLGDPAVGVVSGELVFVRGGQATAAGRGMSAYWEFEKFIRRQESRFRSVPGATGALYALRRSLFRPIPEHTLLDDVAIPMQAVEQGARCVLEDGAVAYDEPSSTAAQETVRKRRTLAGNVQLIRLFPRWLAPGRNPIWFEFMSHKVARLLSPFCLLALLAGNAGLAAAPIFAALLKVQVAGYAMALLGGLLSAAGLRAGVLGIPWMFLVMNGVLLRAVWDGCRGRHAATWQKAY